MSAVSNISATRSQPLVGGRVEEDGRSAEEREFLYWRDRARVVISPTASPSAMGLFGFAAATLIVSGDLAGWYGNTHNLIYFAPFCLAFGGIGQFLAGMWSYKARDTIATVVHTMWGAFWIGFGILWLMMGAKAIPLMAGTTKSVGFGMWFVMLSLLTMVCAFAALAKNFGVFGTLASLSGGSGVLAAGLLSANHTVVVAAGWILVVSVGFAIYTGAALIFADTYGRVVLPMGEWNKRSNVPGQVIVRPIEYPGGMPGARVGQ